MHFRKSDLNNARLNGKISFHLFSISDSTMSILLLFIDFTSDFRIASNVLILTTLYSLIGFIIFEALMHEPGIYIVTESSYLHFLLH